MVCKCYYKATKEDKNHTPKYIDGPSPYHICTYTTVFINQWSANVFVAKKYVVILTTVEKYQTIGFSMMGKCNDIDKLNEM